VWDAIHWFVKEETNNVVQKLQKKRQINKLSYIEQKKSLDIGVNESISKTEFV
jgi:hypothetical protein